MLSQYGVLNVWTYLAGTIFIVLLPGPNSLFVLATGAGRGVRAGYQAALGVFVGDSINDAQAGRSAGTQVLVVPYGYNEGRDVRELDVDGIVDTLVNAAQWVALWNQNQNAAKAQA